MTRKFREWTPDQNHLFPPSPRDWLPQNHLVYFLLDVCEQIDVSPIVDDYDSEKGGQPPFHPRMMLVLLLYAYSVGTFSSRKIMGRCETDVAFRVIVGEDVPDFRRIAEFRSGNAQAVANEAQIIVSADVTDQANDSRQVEPMIAQTLETLDAVGVEENVGAFTADAGYFSEDNVTTLEANERLEEAYIATGRLKHHEQVPDAPKGRPPKDLTTKEKMARKLRTKKGRTEYARRKAIVEPPFGQIKHCRGYRQFLLRGLEQMQGEWKLVCLTHNLLKVFATVC